MIRLTAIRKPPSFTMIRVTAIRRPPTAKLHNDPTASDLKTAETFVTCCVRIRVMALSNYGRLSTQRCCQRKVLSLSTRGASTDNID